jgi:hypothetical protein
MTRFAALLTITAAGLALGGCVAGMAMSAAGMVAQSAQGRQSSNAGLQPQAREACTAQAAKYGTVHVIDVEQHSTIRIIVWGAVETAQGRQSFECDFGRQITGFKLRPITLQR